jgi:uncharacterized protein (DUF362 family)
MRCNRRRFLHDSALLVGASQVAPFLDVTRALAAAVARSRVAVVRRPGVTLGDGRVRAAVVREMVLRAVQDATGLGSAADAFASLFGPDDVVGIKVNCLAGRRMSTSPEVALALAEGVQLAGVQPHNVVIWERSSRELERAGYRVQKDRFALRVLGTDGDYEAEPVDAGSVGGCLSRLVTRTCTAQINAPVLKDHDLAGISGGLKNWYGAIHNPNKYHDNGCAPYVADLSALSPLRQRTRLVVCDALYAQCQGGPAHSPEFVWPHEGVLASTDPVALDAVATRILGDRRRLKGLPSLQEAGRPPRWLALAAAHGLGVADLSRVQVIEA